MSEPASDAAFAHPVALTDRERAHGSSVQFGRGLNITVMSLLVVTLIVHLALLFSSVLQQLLIATFIAYLIVPAHRWLVKRGMSTPVAAVVLLSAFLMVSYLIGRTVYHTFADVTTHQLSLYQKRLDRFVHQISSHIPSVDGRLLKERLLGEQSSVQMGVQSARAVLGTFFGFLEHMLLVVIYLAFLLAEQATATKRIEAAFDPEQAERIKAMVGRINASISQYLAVKTLVSFMIGVLTTVVLILFGVEYAFLWGVIAFLANYVPYVGSVIGVSLPVLLSLVQFESPWKALAIFVLLEVVHQGIGFFIEPRMAGERLDLSPLVILLALAVGASLWGTVGMILAVPLAAVVKIILENIPETKPIATLLSNR